ncbi:GFA family protein [Deefgea piscis]|uniref:GFA family protein n=1 Tax=Deefgea piscis TaxID=2739061 RepID=UPI001C804862|nr:GFA family protein [Deefgea piscis]
MPNYHQIGSTQIQTTHRASCHCGSVVLEIKLPNGVENPRYCDCSVCRRRSAVTSSVPLKHLRIIQGEEHLTLYQFNTRIAKHYFCKICGIYTHHQRRSDPNVYAYNVGCLEKVNPFDLGTLPISDGINHISDRTQNSQASDFDCFNQ